MKFIDALSKALSENFVLKYVVLILVACIAFLVLMLIRGTSKQPLLIERACSSKALASSNLQQTEEEIKFFIKEALIERFDTDVKNQRFTSDREWSFKQQELKDLTNRQIKQRLIVNNVKIADKEITVDCDRVISVGDVRAAFSFPLKVSIQKLQRSGINPYGLILADIKPIQKEDQNEKK